MYWIFLCRQHAVIWMLTSIRYEDGITTSCGYDNGLKKHTRLI